MACVTAILDNETLKLHLTHFYEEKKMARFGFRAGLSLIWGGGGRGLTSLFILSKIGTLSRSQLSRFIPPEKKSTKKSGPAVYKDGDRIVQLINRILSS